MGLFGKLFSKKTDPELERLAQSLEHAFAESKKPQGPQGLAKSAIKGAKTRRWLFELLEEFEADKGGIGAGVAADGMFYHPQAD
jgi:TorA maturation chaperone TorD